MITTWKKKNLLRLPIIFKSILIVALLFLTACEKNLNKSNESALIDGVMVTNGVKHTVNLDDINDVLPSDAIPSIDDPKFITREEADLELDESDIVLGLDINDDVRTYPQNILNWHEIVNDEVGGSKITITFCPLCGSGIAFKSLVMGKETEFGTSGKLYNSNLVMYDRLTNTLWSQIDGIAIKGELAGQRLEIVPIVTSTWGNWKKIYPNTKVLSRQTGFIRDYDSYPYGNYEASSDILFPVVAEDTKLHPKSRVYGIEVNKKFKAYPKEEVKKVNIINDELGGVKLLVLYDRNLDTVYIFERNDQEFVLESGNIKSIDNEYVFNESGIFTDLKEVEHVNVFWFSWFAFHSNTEVFLA